ncbi:uncharacterized protein LOC108220480 isoform X1 [Daucus carota subsp. sativus]|uniref:uncharacterized protein LOC108220480 isoform X1 n=1 Tax=Daucus carota subsp. sativus TaxID=79200 RepID=UPI0007EF1489|nr:PREDICTED: uncharacterized protein LOC108220480 isoform X1 [Daucus carota subsp. sativus]
MVASSSFSARQVPLPQSSISQTTSLLFDSLSSSLALSHSDSSISLYPSFSPLSSLSSSLSFPQTFISAPTSSAAFLPLINPSRRLLFLAVSPSHGGASILLRFWTLKHSNTCFVRAHVECNHKLMHYDAGKSGVVFGVSHGACVKVAVTSNVFVMYCVSSRMVYVFAVRMVGGEGDENESVKLMRTGVVECSVPVFGIGVSSRFLVLGEFDGVRVFPLQILVKGKVKKSGSGRLLNLCDGKGNGGDENLDGKVEKNVGSTKLRSARLRQDSKEGGACFVPFKGDSDSFNSIKLQMKPVKAIDIEALSPNEFLIMDSASRIHHLRLSNSVIGSEVSCHMNQLSVSINVQKMAVLPGAQTFWISDGEHTVHTISLSDLDTSIIGGERKDDDKRLIQISVTSAIFSSETIQQLVPSAADAILVLGQGSIFAYTIS